MGTPGRRTDTHLTVQPVIDLADHAHTEAYEARGRLRSRSELIHLHWVFPWCTKSARSCDRYDPWIEELAKRASRKHRVLHDWGGATCD